MPRVVVLGSSNTDMTVRLPRLPAPGQTLLGGSFALGPGGKGANQAIAARRAGAEVVFVTAVGDDSFGKQALDLYRDEGIDSSLARVLAGVPSGVALIFVADGGENMIGVAPGANAELTAHDIDHLPDSLFAQQGVLLASLEVPRAAVTHMIERASKHGMKVVLNPAPAPESLQHAAQLPWRLVDVLTPNRSEAASLSDCATETDDDIVCTGRRLLELGVRSVVMTLGSDGCLVCTARDSIKIPTYPVPVVDTVGAGDAFNGALATALAAGRSLGAAAAWANAAAALAVTRSGAQACLPTCVQIDLLFATKNQN